MFRTAHVLLFYYYYYTLLFIYFYLLLILLGAGSRIETHGSLRRKYGMYYDTLLYCFPFSPHKRLRFPFALKKA